jgi:hypothetical protein
MMAQPTELRQLFIEKWRASLVGSLLQLQQQIAEAEREKQRQEIEDQLLANRTLADALDPHQISAGGSGIWPRELAQAQPGAGEAVRPHVAAGASARGDRRPAWAQRAGAAQRGQDAAAGACARAGGGAK